MARSQPVNGEGGGLGRVGAGAGSWRASDELLCDIAAITRDIPAVWYWNNNLVPLSASADPGKKLLGSVVGLGDQDLVNAVPREDLAVHEDVASLTPGSGDVFFDPVRLFVECERIVMAPERVPGCDPDVVGHPEILNGFSASTRP